MGTPRPTQIWRDLHAQGGKSALASRGWDEHEIHTRVGGGKACFASPDDKAQESSKAEQDAAEERLPALGFSGMLERPKVVILTLARAGRTPASCFLVAAISHTSFTSAALND